jgi:hypothetical protein
VPKLTNAIVVTISLFLWAHAAQAGPVAVGAAPKGDATSVASRIIKYNFPSCKRVSGAVRAADGAIRAKCDGTEYLVFTVFNAKEGKTIELAMNCAASKSLLSVSC